MAIRNITGTIEYADGAIPANSRAEFYLSGVHIDAVTIAHSAVYAPLNGTGDISVYLYPNDVGYGASRYNVDLVTYSDSQYIKEIARVNLGKIYVEDTDGQNLQDLLALFSGPSEPLTVAQQASAEAIAAAELSDDLVQLARDWASKDEDTTVADGLFSALHYAAKAEASADRVDLGALDAAVASTTVYRADALAAAVTAAAARDASFTGADVYTDIATGRAAVADTAQFTVVTTGAVEAVRYRRDSSTTQTELARYPTSASVDDLRGTIAFGPQIDEWQDVTLDDVGAFVRGFDNDGSEWRAIGGEIVEVFPNVAQIAPSIDDYVDVTLDATGRFVAGLKADGTIWVAVGGVVQQAGQTTLTIQAIGDSTTCGADIADPTNDAWPTLLGSDLGVTILNQGKSGARTDEIAWQVGAIRLFGKLTAASLSASGAVTITGAPFSPMRAGGTGTATMVFRDGTTVLGTLIDSGGSPVFTRLIAGDAKAETRDVEIFSTFGLSSRKSSLVFVNGGVNDEPLIEAATRTVQDVIDWHVSVSRVCPNAIFWSMLDRGLAEAPGTTRRDTIIDVINASLRELFGARYIDVRGYLASAQALLDAVEFDALFAPTADDTAAAAGNYCPPSFRVSGGSVHLNELGHQLQARFMAQHMRSILSDTLTA